MSSRKFLIAVSLCLLIARTQAQTPSSAIQESQTDFAARMKWWNEARFGLFIHWGLYSVPAGEWKDQTGYGEWIRHSAHIPVEEYDKFLAQFNPVKFDADAWVRTAKEAGMKYIVITSKHHDGFCLFDSKFTDFDVASTPFHKDILKELAEACRKEGMKLCFYHSIMDWHHPDYLPRRNWETTRTSEGADFERFVQYVKNELKELLTNYGDIGVLWFDGNWESTWSNERGRDLYNYVRSLQPNIIINNRVGQPPPSESGVGFRDVGIVGDYGTPEQEIPATGLPDKYWETCMTMNNHWGFNRRDVDWKSTGELIRDIADIASKGGNFLLNVGPTPDGLFPESSVDRLHAVGEWMKVNGEAIYGTSASPFDKLEWGRCTQKPIPGGTRLYLHVFKWPLDGKLILHGISNLPAQSYLLSDRDRIACPVGRNEDALVVNLPARAPDSVNAVAVLDITGPPDVIEQPLISSDHDIFIGETSVLVADPRVSLVRQNPNVELRYTLDGSPPTINSPLFKDRIQLARTTTVRARCFRDGKAVSSETVATFTRVTPRPSVNVQDPVPGLHYKCYEGDWDNLPDFDKLKPVREDTLSNITLSRRNREEYCGLTFTGFIRLPEDDVYKFFTSSDDGSRLYIDDSLIVDNDGLHAMSEKSGVVPLAVGFHALRVTFFQKTGDVGLKVSYARRKMSKRPLPAEALFHTVHGQAPKHTFALGQRDFLLDGKPFQIIAGEMHFARIPREYWRQRLKMARAMGLNTIATYVFWNYHESEQGHFDFQSENRNIAAFIRTAQEEGLWVMIRPGPYACAEWEFGGFPWWLLKEKDLVVRGRDPRFLAACRSYLKRLGEEISPLQITRGGPIIMVQVENEYGSYGEDKEYVGKMRDYIREAGIDVPLYSADGPGQVRNASVPEVLPAINGEDNAQTIRDTVNKWNNGRGPYLSPEFYPGWLDHWGERHSLTPVEEFIGKYDTLLSEGVSVSLYMFHGGTNFGFTSGANYDGHYQPQPTSYDYDAPLDEAGRATWKYFRFREVIAKHLAKEASLPDIPPSNPVIEIPRFKLKESLSLFDALPEPVKSETTLSMEDMGQGSGWILYRTVINTSGEGKLLFNELRDYGIILLNGRKVASLDRRHKQKKLTIRVTSTPATLDILVENGGRINFGRQMINNRKGITERVLLNGAELRDWNIYSLPMENPPAVRFGQKDVSRIPAFHRGIFSLPQTGDAFLDLSGWGKGCVCVNGHSLGRFWYIGPQQTLYCPGVWLREGENEIVVLELEDKGKRTIQGLKEPILNQLKPDELAPPLPKRTVNRVQLDPVDLVATGSFVPGDSEQVVRFPPIQAKYVCLESISSLHSDPFASIAELYVLDANGNKLDREFWKVYSIDSEELFAEDGRAENAFDDDVESIWHTQWGTAKPPHPHAITLDLGAVNTITGLIYESRQGNAPGKIKEYRIYARKLPPDIRR